MDQDGVPININGTTHNTVIDRRRFTYENVIEVEDSIDGLPGEYSCAVNNRFGTSNSTTGKG